MTRRWLALGGLAAPRARGWSRCSAAGRPGAGGRRARAAAPPACTRCAPARTCARSCAATARPSRRSRSAIGRRGTRPPRPRAARPRPRPTDSPTNVQEAGVDEPDIVKTAGDDDPHRRRARRCARSTRTAARPALRDSIELPRRPGQQPGLRLRAARRRRPAARDRRELRIRRRRRRRRASAAPDVGYPGEPRTVLAEVDISDPAAMRIAADDDLRRLLRQRPADRLDRPPGELELPLAAGRDQAGHGRAMLPDFTLTDERIRRRAPGQAGRLPRRRPARRASPAPGCSPC